MTPRLKIMLTQMFGDVHVSYIKAYVEIQMNSLWRDCFFYKCILWFRWRSLPAYAFIPFLRKEFQL